MSIDKLVVHRKSVIGSVSVDRLKDIFKRKNIQRGLVLGHRVRYDATTDSFRIVNVTTNDRYRKEFFQKATKNPVIILETATVEAVYENSILTSISVGPDLIRVRLPKPDHVDDLESADNRLRERLVLVIGKLNKKTVQKGKAVVGVYYEPVSAEVKVVKVKSDTVNDIPTLVLLFIASGMLKKTDDGKRIRIREELEKKLDEVGIPPTVTPDIIGLLISLEVARWLHVFSTELLVQASVPGIGKSSFYARLRHYLSVSVYGFPPTKSFILRDHRFKPPKPGDIYIRDVVVFDEIGERSREAVRYAKEIWPEVKRAIEEDVGIRARLVLLSNRFNEKKGASDPRPAWDVYTPVRNAVAKIGYKAGIDQLEGRAERAIITVTATEDLGLHELRKRSDYILDPHIFRSIVDKNRQQIRTRRSAFILLRKRLRELQITPDVIDNTVITKAFFPLKLSNITVNEHQNALIEFGIKLREALEQRKYYFLSAKETSIHNTDNETTENEETENDIDETEEGAKEPSIHNVKDETIENEEVEENEIEKTESEIVNEESGAKEISIHNTENNTTKTVTVPIGADNIIMTTYEETGSVRGTKMKLKHDDTTVVGYNGIVFIQPNGRVFVF